MESPLTFNEFQLQVMEAYNAPRNKDKKKGRVAYAELRLSRPDLAGEVAGTANDPFADDKRLDQFWEYIEEHWKG
jgi:hypothetical protein